MNPPSQTIDAGSIVRAFDQVLSSDNSWTLKKLAGDASSRHYYRLADNAAPNKSYVLQVADRFEEEKKATHPFLSAQNLLTKLRIPVPKVHGADAGRGWILLEDLGDETLQNHPEKKLYEKALELLVEWTLAALPTLDAQAPHFGWSFDFEKLNFEMNHTAEHLVRGLFKLDPKVFLSLTQRNSQYLAARPRFFCHRDYHSRNIMVHKKQLFVIDFQDARMGPITYDLVSLLWDPYVRLSEEWREELLEHWLLRLRQEAKKRKVAAVSELLERKDAQGGFEWTVELERTKVQRLLKAAGSYASFYVLKGRRDYLPALEPALRDAAEALQALVDRRVAQSADVELLTEVERLRQGLPAILKSL